MTAPAASPEPPGSRPLTTIEQELVASMGGVDARRWLARRAQRERQWAVQNALRDLLRLYPWEWFGHLTFETCHSLDYAKRAVGRYFNFLSRRAWGRNYTKRRDEGLYAFVAFERQKRGDWHAHFLAAGTREMRRLDAMDAWFTRHGFARIYAYDPERAGAGYAVKYATKEFDGDYALIGSWRGREALPLFRSHG
jgi:hypothetical protein